jgi:hypothetical protein
MTEFGVVVAAARALLEAGDGEVELSDAYVTLAGQFGVKPHPYGRSEQDAWDRFRARVLRAFNRLDAEDACRKVGANRAGPDGNYTPSPRYFTPAAWERAAAKGRQRDEAARDEAERFTVVHGRLAALGILTYDAGSPLARREGPRMHVHQWERLLDMATSQSGAGENS